MKPVIVLAGRPNVGKSTLFNQLTRSRDALVAAEPGLTRDRQYGDGRVGDRAYWVVDTGGIAEPVAGDPELARETARQTERALDEADAVLLLVDARAGLAAADRDIAQTLRRGRAAAYVVVNKSEGMDAAAAVAEFHALGLGEPVAVSAAHARGIEPLMQRVLAAFPPQEPAESEAQAERPRVAVIGRPNVGKSTLVNALLGEQRVIVYDRPGTTRDAVRVPFERDGKAYMLIDTAGVRRRARVEAALERHSVVKTLQAIELANVVVVVLDAEAGVSEQDATLAGYAWEEGRSLVLVANKWDALDAPARARFKAEMERKLPFLQALRAHFVSALRGTGVDALFPAIDAAYAAARRELSTPALNAALKRAVQAVPPPIGKGRRIKLKFAHQGGKNPPLVVIHGNQVERVPAAYRRYLANVFRETFRLEGTPVRVEFVSGVNPFETQPKA